MKYLRLLKKYLFVFVGALLFGLAAVKLKSAQRAENKATDRVQELTESQITIKDAEINAHVDIMKAKQKKTKEVRENALKTLDNISKHSGSVKSLLDDYNHDRVSKLTDSN